MDDNAVDKNDPRHWLNIIKTKIQNGDPYSALDSVKECEEVLAEDCVTLALLKDDAARMVLEYARSKNT